MFYKDTLMWKEISQTPDIFAKEIKDNSATVSKLVADIKSSGITNFVAAARGTSDHALIYFKYGLECNSSYTVGLAAPSVVTMYNGKINYKNSVVIGCSQSGKAADVLEVLKRANEQGAITISITNDEKSPMAKEAKYHLFCAAEEEKSVAATKTFSAQLFNLLWLAAALSENKEQLELIK
ncbi:MAG: SIS domain-containing protein, partial [Clostridia bacterium]|nr:SIS domain-containing protein [Clostridia bacterium]